MLRDIFSQAMEAMRHNGRRTAITIVGMAWGIATVVLLLAYGAGFGRAFETIFAQFGTNMIGVFPGTTSEQVGGTKAGVTVRLQQEDVERIQETVPGVQHVSPVMWKQVPVQNDLHTYTWEVDGVTPALQDIQKRGPFYNGGGPATAKPCCRDRIAGKDKAFFRNISPGPDGAVERHQL